MIADEDIAPKIEHCVICGNKLVGRQLSYCGPNCKNLYHRSGQAKGTATIKRIIEILRNNRNAIKSILGDQRATDSNMVELKKKGYNPKYHTHLKEYGGRQYTFSFEYGFRDDGDKLRLVKDYS